jgi:hypothetical protein
MKRKDTWLVNLSVAGVGDVGVARKADGFDIESEEVKVRPGGMAPEVSLGGKRSRNAATLTFWNNEQREAQTPALERAAGAGDGAGACVITRQPLDGDGNPNGKVRTYTGTLRNVKPVEYDEDSNDPAELEVEITLNESAT